MLDRRAEPRDNDLDWQAPQPLAHFCRASVDSRSIKAKPGRPARASNATQRKVFSVPGLQCTASRCTAPGRTLRHLFEGLGDAALDRLGGLGGELLGGGGQLLGLLGDRLELLARMR